MTEYQWVKMPSKWIREGGLRDFQAAARSGELGRKVTALKLYIALVAHAGNPDADPLGAAELSYGVLADFADTSRAIIAPALAELRNLVDVTRGTGQSRNIYTVRGFDTLAEDRWAKMPRRACEALPRFSPRSVAHLSALRVYLLLLAFRYRRTNEAQISYEKIREYTALSRSRISDGVSVLCELDLVRVRTADESDPGRSNRYWIRGLAQQTEARERAGTAR